MLPAGLTLLTAVLDGVISRLVLLFYEIEELLTEKVKLNHDLCNLKLAECWYLVEMVTFNQIIQRKKIKFLLSHSKIYLNLVEIIA